MASQNDNPNDLIPARRVKQKCGGVSDMAIWRWARECDFPAPDMVIGGRRYWREASIDAWLAAQAAKKGATPTPPRKVA